MNTGLFKLADKFFTKYSSTVDIGLIFSPAKREKFKQIIIPKVRNHIKTGPRPLDLNEEKLYQIIRDKFKENLSEVSLRKAESIKRNPNNKYNYTDDPFTEELTFSIENVKDIFGDTFARKLAEKEGELIVVGYCLPYDLEFSGFEVKILGIHFVFPDGTAIPEFNYSI